MNPGDIQFGEVERRVVETGARPDQDRAVAVCPYGEPSADEMRVYMSCDVFAEIETHAHSDASVELGGVLIGKQYKDDRGRPFVLVSDSLRAKHYESTASRFTYTHQTWGEITLEKDKLFPDLDIVGWYHTHPGWGIFLSGHDTFIHDNFFAQALDVAYVVDPCNEDRGFFSWVDVPGGGRRLPQLQGFHVFAPRGQRAILEDTVARVEGSRKSEMIAAAGNPIIVQSPQRPIWPGLAAVVLGMILLLQTAVLTAIYRSLLDRDPEGAAAKARLEEQAKHAKAAEELEREKIRIEAERKMLFAFTDKATDGSISSQWDDVRKKAVLEAERANSLDRKRQIADAAAEAITKKSDELRARIERQQKDIDDLKAYKNKSEEIGRKIAELEKGKRNFEETVKNSQLYEAHKEKIDHIEELEGARDFWQNLLLMGVVPLALLGWAAAVYLVRHRLAPVPIPAPAGAGASTAVGAVGVGAGVSPGGPATSAGPSGSAAVPRVVPNDRPPVVGAGSSGGVGGSPARPSGGDEMRFDS